VDTQVRAALTPEESLEIIKRTLGQARRELIMPDGPIAKAWGLAVLVGFGGMAAIWRSRLGDRPLAAGLVAGLVWLLAVGAALTYSSRKGKTYYSPEGGGVWSPVMARLLWIWLLGVAMAAGTAVAAGLPAQGVAAVIAFFVASVYVTSGILCFDNVETGTGLWLGTVNAAALPLPRIGYALIMAILAGGGLIVSGWLDDRRWARVRAEADP
jgi:hypothetical protein